MNIFSSKISVNVVSLRGIIGDLGRFQKGLTIDNCSTILEKAFTLKKPKVVVININSPGGSPVQSELIYNKIRELAEKNKTKVITIAEDVAASGGYMLMCSGDYLIANTTVESSRSTTSQKYISLGETDLITANLVNESLIDFTKETKSMLEMYMSEYLQ